METQQPIKQKDLQSKTFDDFIPALSIPRNLASFIAWNSHKQDFLVKTLYEAIERYAAYREQQANEIKDMVTHALRVQSRDIKQYEAYCKELELLLTKEQYKEAYARAVAKVPNLPLSEVPSFEQQAKHAGFIEGCEVQKIKCAKEAENNSVPGCLYTATVDRVSVANVANALSPYAPREKGGEDGV